MSLNPLIRDKYNTYPLPMKALALEMRDLIYEVASGEGIADIEESLKWGEPCFKAPDGSPIRMDWKEKAPEVFNLYFICSTSLVETFKSLYGDALVFEGNRGIIIDPNHIPYNELRHCISLALRYHLIKDLPFLGA